MKILFLTVGSTHYLNLVLSKLNQSEQLELLVVVPDKISHNIGDGVYQTREGASFRIIEMQEYSFFGLFSSYRGLSKLLLREKPDAVMTSDFHLYTFIFNIPVIAIMKLLGIKLILKTIPFRLPTYDEAKRLLNNDPITIAAFPKALNTILVKLGMLKVIRRAYLYLRKFAFNIPDAHVNYVDDAYRIFGSYGVPQNKIFITRNSPDTDFLFAVRQSILSASPILPASDYRLIHVGRLVEWKKVDMLLRVFARLKAHFPQAELLIIGTGPMEKQLKDLALDLRVSADVMFLGGLYDPYLLGRYLMASSIYVLAGMGGLSINDAMCFGLPVICSVCDGTEKALVRDEFNGKYFIEGDDNDLFDKITYLFEHQDLRKRMGHNSTEIIRNEINIHTVVQGYLKAFHAACSA